MFALADGTAAGSVQASPFLEREATAFARGRFRSEAIRMDGLRDMLEMVEGFSFFNLEQFRNLSQIEAFLLQSFSHPLPQS
jgi:hypothetical protein